jgi:MFS family permease
VIQIAGAVGRIGSGVWSDRVGSRLRPMRQLAVGAALVLLTFALGDAVAPWLAIAALVVGGVVTVADNGLAFTAVAEIAGPMWSGRALVLQRQL